MKNLMILGLVALAMTVTLPAAATIVPPPPVFGMHVELTQSNAWDGAGYVWEYKVTMDPENNKGLSHWVLELCTGWFDPGTGTSYLDKSFFPGDTWTTPTKGGATGGDTYSVEYGHDPSTGATGLKYNIESGDQLDAPGEMDFFSFRLTEYFEAVPIEWTGKDGNVADIYGTVFGPTCEPDVPEVPEPTTLLLLGSGLIGGGFLGRRRKR